MRRFLLVAVLVGGCSNAPGRGEDDARRAIESQVANWLAAVEGEDAEGLARVYSTDAVFLPPGAPPMTGRDTIRGLFAAMFGAMDARYTFSIERLDVVGEQAWRWGQYEVVAETPSGDTLRADDKFIEIWRREKDGTWRIVADIWNANASPAPPSSAPPSAAQDTGG